VFHFVEPDVLVARAYDVGLGLEYRRTVPLPSVKAFEVLRFVKTISSEVVGRQPEQTVTRAEASIRTSQHAELVA
jgi:hypothetical protein